jgi:hypothetical protein
VELIRPSDQGHTPRGETPEARRHRRTPVES